MPILSEIVKELTTGKTPTPWERKLPDPYPDYNKAMVTQGRGDPVVSGLTRGASTGLMAAVLSGLAARMATDDRQKVLLASLIGGGLGTVPGYVSGKRERESENSRLLALRRMGIDTPGEKEFAERFPELADRLTTKGVRV